MNDDVSLAARKVPEVSLLFWVIKLLTTAAGETCSDFLVRQYEPVLVVGIAGLLLAASLALQIATPGYSNWRYWGAVLLVSIFGTMAADVAHVVLGVPYFVSMLAFALCLGLIFFSWRRAEGTLSIHSIVTPRREAFYWATVLATFALGTASGDFVAATLHLGYLAAGVLFGALFLAAPAIYARGAVNEVAAFWFAYIMTRPFGASLADWLGVPPDRGGLDLGTGVVSFSLLVLILLAVASETQSRRRSA